MNQDNIEFIKKVKINQVMSLILIAIGLFYTYLYYYSFNSPIVSTMILVGTTFILFSYLLSKIWFNQTFYFNYLSVILFVALVGTCVSEGGIYSNSIWWLTLIPMFSMYLNNYKAAFCWTLLAITSILVFYLLDLYGYTFEVHNLKSNTPDLKVVDAILMGVLIFSLSYLQERETKAEMDDKERIKKLAVINSIQSSLGVMAGGMAHEIKNPLSIILGHAELLKSKDKEDLELIDERVNTIERAGHRILNVIDGMHVISGLSSENKNEGYDVVTLAENVFGLFSERFRSFGIEFDIIVSNHLRPKLSLHKNAVAAAFFELIKNSYEFLKETDQLQKWVKIKISQEKSTIYIKCEDSGKSIDIDLNQILQPFYTTKHTKSATGLGLNKVYANINSIGGKFYLDQKIENTSFVIELPLQS